MTSDGNTPYDYFTRLAGAFLEGRIYLIQNPPWLNELIPLDGKFFVPYPPMPAILSLPFVAIFNNFQQQILAHILGAGTAILAGKLAFEITKRRNAAIWIALFAGFGNVIWFLSSVGSSWYLGQVAAAFFLTATLYETFTKKRPVIMGMLLGAAYLSRIHVSLSTIFFVFMLIKKPYFTKANFKKIFMFAAGTLPFVLFNFWYNHSRFGAIWEQGYSLIPGVLNEPWYQLGLVHPSYVSRHLEILFKALPVIKNEFPYIFPSWAGLAIWITSPAIFVAISAPFKKKEVQLSVLSIAAISIPILLHGTNGFAQFGYRFATDFIPFVFLILIYALPNRINKWQWAVLVLSILVNAWGVLFINKMGWVV